MTDTNDHPYDDIINLPHHVSPKRLQMSRIDRAAQFSPFAALTGYDAAIQESGRLTNQRIDLTEDSRAELDRKQRILIENLSIQPEVTVTYFVPDERKSGGAYVTVTGRVEKIDLYRRQLSLGHDTVVSFDEIVALESDTF